MSSNPPHPFSPHRSPIRRRTTTSQVNDGGRWTVDNSESRFVSLFAAQSPSRSILRAPNTPLRFHYTSQEKRNEQLRRVSFAREAHLRIFNQNESPDITSRGIPNLFDETGPDYDDHAFNSPASHLFMSNYNNDSPSNRKRRPDLFGSPTAVQQSPKRRTGGAPPSLLARLNEKELDDEGSSADLTRYLSIQPGNVRRNIFEEDDDDDEEEEEDQQQETEKDVSLRRLNISGTSHRPTTVSQPTSKPTPEQRFERIIEQTPERVSEQQQHSFEPTFEATPDPVSEPVFDLGSEPTFEPTPERTTQSVFDPAFEPTPERTSRRTSEPSFELPIRTAAHVNEDDEEEEDIVEKRTELETLSPYNDHGDDMIITQEVPLQHSDRESIAEEGGSSIRYLEEETMLITQEMPTNFASPLYTPSRSTTTGTPVRSIFRDTTPDRRSTTSTFLKQTTPVRSTPANDNRSFLRTPERPVQQARMQSTPLHTATPTRSSVLTPIRESRALYSEQRSFRLHEHTPIRPSEMETVELDRAFSIGDNVNIMEEEYSQLYNTIQDGIIPSQNMSLSEFLGYVGITFPSSTPAKELRRISRINADYGAATEADQAFAAAVVLPELALFKKQIEQLHDFNHKSQESIDRIDREVSATNPQFFSEYLDSDIAIRTKIEERLKEIKTYAALKALQQWLDSWMKSLEPLGDELKKNSENLKLDEEKLASYREMIRPKLSEIVSYKIGLDPVLQHYKQEELEYEKIDHEKLENYEHEIENLRFATEDLKVEAEDLKKEEQDLLDREEKAEHQLQQAQEEIRQAEATIADNKFVTRKELMLEKDSFERLMDMGSWIMQTPEDNILLMILEHNVHVKIDQKKLAERNPDAVYVHMLDSRDRTLGPVAELVHGLRVIAQNKWEIDEIMQDIAIYWNRLMMIQSDLIHIQRRFWIEIESLEYEEAGDAGISCKVCVYSFAGRTKFTISFVIKPKDVVNYPSIDTSSLNLVIHFGGIEHNELKSIIQKELSTHGMDDIVETLTTILEKIAIPE